MRTKIVSPPASDPRSQALTKILQTVEQRHGHAEALWVAASISHPQLMFNALREFRDLAESLLPLLTARPDSPGATQLMITTDTGAFGLYPYMATQAMVERVLRTRDPVGTIRFAVLTSFRQPTKTCDANIETSRTSDAGSTSSSQGKTHSGSRKKDLYSTTVASKAMRAPLANGQFRLHID